MELVDVYDDGTVTVTFQGACAACPASEMTLELVVAAHVRAAVPGVTSVVAV